MTETQTTTEEWYAKILEARTQAWEKDNPKPYSYLIVALKELPGNEFANLQAYARQKFEELLFDKAMDEDFEHDPDGNTTFLLLEDEDQDLIKAQGACLFLDHLELIDRQDALSLKAFVDAGNNLKEIGQR